jgi:uncharacterized protein (TIGR00255 family)
MTSSMTAFARQQSEHDFGTLVWELRSVNHRYLEPSFRIPDSLRYLEGPLRELLRARVQRGKVEAQLKVVAGLVSDSGISINQELMRELRQAIEAVRGQFIETAPLNPMEVLKWPGLVIQREQDTKLLEEKTLELFAATVAALQVQREREGAQLRILIEDRLTQVSAIVSDIRAKLPQILAQQAERLKTQFAELQLQVDPTRIEQEIVLLAQKADVHEELDRLDTHVREVRHTLSQNGQIGRRLDFLMQELNREANTLSSKAIVTATTLGAVELKVLIEQMREQIQNIE